MPTKLENLKLTIETLITQENVDVCGAGCCMEVRDVENDRNEAFREVLCIIEEL